METRLDHRNFPFIRGEEDNSISPAVSFDPSLNSTNRPRFLASPRMDGKPRFPPTRDYRFIVKLVPLRVPSVMRIGKSGFSPKVSDDLIL